MTFPISPAIPQMISSGIQMKAPPRLIGLGHQMRVGKDTIALHLMEQYGYVRVAFADALKDAARAIFAFSEEQLYGSLKEEVDAFWGFSPRWALQRLGTEACRYQIASDIWVRAAWRRVDLLHQQGRLVVMSDVRFTNEAEAIRSWGGILWKVVRGEPGVVAHQSEHDARAFSWDAVIENHGTFSQLYERVEEALARCA